MVLALAGTFLAGSPSVASESCQAGSSALAPVSGYWWGAELQSTRGRVARDCGGPMDDVVTFERSVRDTALDAIRRS